MIEKYRVGRKSKRAIIDEHGTLLLVFPNGMEAEAKEYCDFKNGLLSHQTKFFTFVYNPFIWESAASTVSVHKTKKGAYEAMRKHKLELYEEWILFRSQIAKSQRFSTYGKFGEMEYWGIREITIVN